MKKVKKDIFSKFKYWYLENLHDIQNELPFLPKRINIKKVEKLVFISHDKKRICYSHKKFTISIKWWISFEKSA